LISRVTTLLHSDVQFSIRAPAATKSQDTQETGNYCTEGKNQQKLPRNYLMAELLSKDFKTTMSKMLKEQKKGMEKVVKMMYEQNGVSVKR
jgi:hypothetical protein